MAEALHFLKLPIITTVMRCNVWWLVVVHAHGFLQSPSVSTKNCRHRSPQRYTKIGDAHENENLAPILHLASSHFATQALHAAIRLGIPDILDKEQLSLKEISTKLGTNCNNDALLRTLRLLTTLNVVEEGVTNGHVTFCLTKLGKKFRSGTSEIPSLASCIQHWLERPLWDAWLELPSYILGENHLMTPFARANDGISSDFWYNEKEHPESLNYANHFVRIISTAEIDAVVHGFDWTRFRGQKLVDIGGYNGKLVGTIAKENPAIDCHCFDLPDVIAKVANLPNVTFLLGNILDTTTIPSCDVILMKHFLDRCMWTENETIQILKNCHAALKTEGTLLIADAVLPSYGNVAPDNQLPLFMDALYMLVGREGQRTQMEWESLARESSFEVKHIRSTTVPSCSLIEMVKV